MIFSDPKGIVKDPTYTDISKALGITQERFDQIGKQMSDTLGKVFTESEGRYTRAEAMDALIKADIAQDMTEFALLMFFIGGFVREQEMKAEAMDQMMSYMGMKKPVAKKVHD